VRNHLRLVTDERDKLTQQIEAFNEERNAYEDRVSLLMQDQQMLSDKFEELKQEKDGNIDRLPTISTSKA